VQAGLCGKELERRREMLSRMVDDERDAERRATHGDVTRDWLRGVGSVF
jgi:hypothetical protein